MPEAETEDTPRFAVDYVSCELMLETAKACRCLHSSLERIDVEITDGETRERFRRRMERIALFARMVPSILQPRRLICLGDMCAEKPDWWKANRDHQFCPELTYRDIAALLKLRPHQVRDYIKAVEIPVDCYANLPEIKYY